MRCRWVLLTALCIFAGALVPRACIAWADRSDLLSDERTYDKYAWSFALDEARVEKGKQIYHPLGSFTYRPPGYPLFLGLIYRIRGHSYRDARLVQALLGAASCAMVFLIGQRMFDYATGLAAGLFMATYGLLIQFTRLVLSETLFVFLICCFALSLIVGLRRGSLSTGPFLAAGLFLGLATITRPVGLPLALATFLFFPVALGRKRGWVKASLAFALALLLVVGPFIVKNYQIQGSLIPISTHGGITFWRGVLKGRGDYPPELLSLRDRIGDYPEVQQQQVYYQVALDYLKHHPEAIPGILLQKLKLLLVYTTYQVAHKRIVVPQDPYFWYSLLGFGLLGLVVQPRRLLLEKAFLGAFVIVQIAVTLVYDSGVRYRIPLIPFLALLAAHGLVTTVRRLAGMAKRDKARQPKQSPSGPVGDRPIACGQTHHEEI